MPAASRPRRVDIGFAGGQVLTVRLASDVHDALRKALGSDKSPRWHSFESEDSQLEVDLSQVVYIRLDTERERIGF